MIKSFLYIKNLYIPSYRHGYEALISGTETDGVLEFTSPSKHFHIELYDKIGSFLSIKDGYLLNMDNSINIFQAPFQDDVDIYSINQVSFLYNDLDVSNKRHFNIIYFNFSKIVQKDAIFILSPKGEVLQNPVYPPNVSTENLFYSTYNQELSLFEIEFYVEASTQTGDFLFEILYGTKSIHSKILPTQLKIKKTNLDLSGPIVIKMTSNPPIGNVTDIDFIKWTFTIEDKVNGFDWGYVTLRSDVDSSFFNVSFSSKDVKKGGNQFLGDYDLSIPVRYPCISQNYYITEAAFYDRMNRISFFSVYAPNVKYSPIVNPFTKLLGKSPIFNQFYVQCADLPDHLPSAPEFTAFKVPSTIDVSKTNRIVTLSITATEPFVGMSLIQVPIFYLSTVDNQILECPSKIALVESGVSSNTIYGNSITYSCQMQLPLGFGFPQGIYVSVYGLISNNGKYYGFPTNDLIDKGFNSYIQTTFGTNEPSIQSYFRITERGGDLWIFGRGFDQTSIAHITFNDSTTASIPSPTNYQSAIKIQNIKATDKPFIVSIQTRTLISNSITVIPTIFNIFEPSSSSDSMTPTSSPSSTPIPTNKPQYCLGSPVCGGPLNGKCVENQGCVCFSPWIGNDCSSQIIIIDPPTANKTDPTTNITLPGTNNNNSTVTYKSLITLVSIREVNILGDVIYEKPFEKWTVKQLDDTTFIYNTTLEITKKDKKSTTTNVNVTLKWFTNETNVTFANEQLIMNPSSMKYTIEISDYSFDDSLSQLQLIMSALIQSNTTDDICSVREFGETTSGDNSNYVKIQIDNHSLYGRFIRRGIIDSTIRSVTNILLDKYMKPISGTKELQSYIGIQIPYYRELIILDPDFSVLIDSNSASSKSGSICSNKSKLSGPKIAGIVIGCFTFVSIIIVSILYHIIKKRNQKKFISNVNKKVQEMKEL
ncbi:hypothetical protein DICPUDRAFT_153065 [Dictyostelium purpureum]|uniref:EGF-like domain-containing protein n=1 Tax=Dictyostelium purpureum TaxID=5786 RepID=F0ZMZ0_DICPU|nr:uncharacterized protein DICPUDRAFT_153065 [Dictyostelium purpureum]EGC34702.1 hypothetical protein DICPUDRAFT_153065 [Dictyostelium purpureum]|eukprot:XP_003288787.1 hypothetical protein DICPUDRAFT_153065 [Dictyostelium purpureum]